MAKAPKEGQKNAAAIITESEHAEHSSSKHNASPWLLYGLISVCSSGFLLFGYDQGVMSGVVISPDWLRQMNNPSALMIGTITSVYDVGAAAGAIFIAFVGERIGRRKACMLGSGICVVGTILQTASYERIQMIFGRIITGIAVGILTSTTPVWQCEVSRHAARGWQTCCQLTTMLFGLMVAYWLNYGLYFTSTSIQWRLPLAVQAVFAIYCGVGSIFVYDSPRWTIKNRSVQEGAEILARYRNLPVEDPSIRREVADIQAAVRLEQKVEGSWMDIFRDGGVQGGKRVALACGLQFMQQMTGINIVTYYAPTIFKNSVHLSQELALLLGCLLQVWYILASFIPWYTIDRLGRRFLLISCAIGMCLVLVAEAVSVEINTTKSGISAIVWIFMFEFFFTNGWMACVWIYPPEILPLKLRAKGAALGAAADFLGNFLVVEVTPIGIQNIGWKFYLVWAVLNLVNAILVWSFYPETGGIQLEAIEEVFQSPEEHKKQSLRWSAVEKAYDVRKRVQHGEKNRVDF